MANVKVTALHVSSAEAKAVSASPQDVVTNASSSVNAGATSSTTSMVWTWLLLFPQASSAVWVRRMVYSWGQSPITVESNQAKVSSEQLSSAVMALSATMSSHARTRSAGVVRMVGATVSVKTTSWMALLALPHSSSAVNVRINV